MKKIYLLLGLVALTLIGINLKVFIENDNASAQTALEKSQPKDTLLIDMRVEDKVGYVDLNQDQHMERIEVDHADDRCVKSDCTAFIYSADKQLISTIDHVALPIMITQNSTQGWQDLIVKSHGKYYLIQHNGTSYPKDPSTAPESQRQAMIDTLFKRIQTTEIYQQDGYDLTYVETNTLTTDAVHFTFIFKHYGDPQYLYQFDIVGVDGALNMTLVPLPISPIPPNNT